MCIAEKMNSLRNTIRDVYKRQLYGRNTMGGLIKVHTKSPFTYQGTDIRMGAATYNNYNVSLTPVSYTHLFGERSLIR